MTDEQIIRGLKCCITCNCYSCPDAVANSIGKCEHNLMRGALDLINRKNEKIEGLIKGQEALQRRIRELDAETMKKDIEIKLLIEKKEAAYDEISELKVEIERAQGINEILESAFVAECDLSACPRKKEIRDEAIEDALNRAKKRIGDSHFQNYGLAIMEIMDVAKEMEGDEDA